ncbi:MAG: SDR family NAD(P)-dependent oxidoreductase [Thermoleophilia bacterium]
MSGASVLVAGASGGLGSAIARELHGRGATLTLVARRPEPLEAMRVPGARLAADLRTAAGCAAACDAAIAHGGRLDVVVNAVGVVAFGPVAGLSAQAMEELFRTNALLPIMLAQSALRAMPDGGAIVNLSGVIAESNVAGMAAYGASKAAVRAFDEAFAREARRVGIRVLDARPPHTETGLAGRAIEGTAPDMPPGRDPADVARVIVDAVERGARDLPSSAF